VQQLWGLLGNSEELIKSRNRLTTPPPPPQYPYASFHLILSVEMKQLLNGNKWISMTMSEVLQVHGAHKTSLEQHYMPWRVPLPSSATIAVSKITPVGRKPD
jgi:hypothetical protein